MIHSGFSAFTELIDIIALSMSLVEIFVHVCSKLSSTLPNFPILSANASMLVELFHVLSR